MADGDIIVPDTKPDILKILQVDAVSCVTDKNVENGRAYISGRVDLKILYIPDKDGETLRSIITSFDYSQPVDNKRIEPDMRLIAESSAERVEFSLLNSRKLRVKTIVALDFEIIRPETAEIAVDTVDGGDIELKKESIGLQNSVDLCDHDFLIRESIEIPGGQASISELLKLDAKIVDTDYKTVTGKIVVKGVAAVSALYLAEGGRIEFTEAELPFTEVLDCADAGDETLCDIDYSITDVNCSVIEDSDGDCRVIGLEIMVNAQVNASENISLDMICDCFAPRMKTKMDCSEAELEQIVSRPSVQNTIREIISPASGAPEVSSVYNVITKPYVGKTELQGTKLLCEGHIEAYVLYLSASAENPVYSIKKDIPYSYMLECDASGNDLTPRVKAEVKHTSYNLNASGEIELRCILSINANIARKRVINVINSVETCEPDKDDAHGIVIYFVQNGDALWEIAKRYSVPQEEIMRFNNMQPEDNLKTGSRLFIPN